jgi:hypothetical protein
MTDADTTSQTRAARRLLLRRPPADAAEAYAPLDAALAKALAAQQKIAERAPGVAPPGELEVDDAGYWLVEGEGGDLEGLLEAAPLAAQQAAAIGVQLCDALLAACYPTDRLPTPHGSVRPKCIGWVDERVQLRDVGIAEAVTSVLGPTAPREEFDLLAPYVARELWLNPQSTGELRDLFAVGVILYELATGTHPYGVRRDDFNDCEQRILTTEPRKALDANPELDPKLAGILDRAVARRESDRFPSLVDLRAALLPWVDASALQVAETLPAEALRTALRPGEERPDATTVAMFTSRFVSAVAEQSHWVSAASLVVETGEIAWDEETPGRGTLALRVSCPPVVSTAEEITLALAVARGELAVASAAEAHETLLSTWAPAVLEAQRRALPELIAPLRAGPFPEAELEAPLERPVPATLARLQVGGVTRELALVWQADAGAWATREAGGLSDVAIAVAGELVEAGLERELQDATDTLAGHRDQLRWELRPQVRGGALPAEVPFTAALRRVGGEGTEAPLVELEVAYPLQPDRKRTRALRSADKAFRAEQAAAAKDGGGNAALGWMSAAMAVLIVAAGVWAFLPGNSNGSSGKSPEEHQADFDERLQRLRENAQPRLAYELANALAPAQAFLDDAEEHREFLTAEQQAALDQVESWTEAVTAAEEAARRAKASHDAEDVRRYVERLKATFAWPAAAQELTGAVDALIETLKCPAAGDGARDLRALTRCLRAARRQGVALRQRSGFAAAVPEMVDVLKGALVDERIEPLADALTEQPIRLADVRAYLNAVHAALAWPEETSELTEQVDALRTTLECDAAGEATDDLPALADCLRKARREARTLAGRSPYAEALPDLIDRLKRTAVDAPLAARARDLGGRSVSLADLRGYVVALQAALAWPEEQNDRTKDAGTLLETLDAATTQDADDQRWALAYCLQEAQREAAALAERSNLAAPLPQLVEQARGTLVKQRVQALTPAFAEAAQWLGTNAAPPGEWPQHVRAVAQAAQARRRLDAIGLYLPDRVLAEELNDPVAALATQPASALHDTLDGLMRWDELAADQQDTLLRLTAWTTVVLPWDEGDRARGGGIGVRAAGGRRGRVDEPDGNHERAAASRVSGVRPEAADGDEHLPAGATAELTVQAFTTALATAPTRSWVTWWCGCRRWRSGSRRCGRTGRHCSTRTQGWWRSTRRR